MNVSKFEHKLLSQFLFGIFLISGCGQPGERFEKTDDSPKSNGRALVDSDLLAVELFADNEIRNEQNDVNIKVVITNNSNQNIRLLRWHTPASGRKEQLFSITRGGSPVRYLGPRYKRPAPREKDFVTLAPAESLTGVASLADYDLTQSGTYRVRYFEDLRPFRSSSLELWIAGRPQANPLIGDEFSAATCSISQVLWFAQAKETAAGNTNSIALYWLFTSSPTRRYTTWFGRWSPTNWYKAKDNFMAIRNVLMADRLTIDCSCTDPDVYAWVRADKPYTVYPCGLFWSAPLTGTDSKVGIVTHSASLFNAVAGTADLTSGKADAEALAVSNPNLAVTNADSYQYFTENDPLIP